MTPPREIDSVVAVRSGAAEKLIGRTQPGPRDGDWTRAGTRGETVAPAVGSTDEFSLPRGSHTGAPSFDQEKAPTCERKERATATNAIEEQVVRAATAGDEAAFTQLVERYRGELQVHAYRMLGSLEDAQDALQEAFLRAWTGRATYRRQSSFRAWLYRITTNACLRLLERRPRRLVPYEAGPSAELGTRPQPPSDLPWLQPYPDLLLDESPEPDDAVVARETIELAFLAAIQHLPPRQRAVLILRDALDWPAEDTAAVLEMSVAAANSALQRARATLQERLPAARLEWATATDAEDAERALLEGYVEAFERHDDRRLVALLREDVRLAMPPHPTWYEGREAVGAFLAGVAFVPGSEAHRFVPTGANRQPAFGVYRGEGADARPFAINVLGIESGLVTDLHFFKYPELFPAFGLPETLR